MEAINYTRKVIKALERMPTGQRDRVQDKFKDYVRDPDSLTNNVTALLGRTGILLRVGDYRVIMNDAGAVLDILDVGHRGSIYD